MEAGVAARPHPRERMPAMEIKEKNAMFKSIKPFILVAMIALVGLSACTLPNSAIAPTQGSPNLIYTAAAETVIAQITQAATGATQPVPTQPGESPQAPAATSTQTGPGPQPSNTAVPPTAVPPTAVPPTSTSVPATCYVNPSTCHSGTL